MKVKRFSFYSWPAGKRALVFLAELRTLLRSFSAVVRQFLWLGLVALVVTLILALLAWQFDQPILGAVHIESPGATHVARFLSKWGDYQTYSVPLAVLIAIFGHYFARPAQRRYWRHVALACFLGASIAGLFSDAFRLTIGRPRPFVLDQHPGLSDRFYGPSFTWYGDYQSFPSGHAATSVGTAAALFLVNPPLGLATSLYAGGVIWARMDLRRHYPSDIIVGLMIGLTLGSAVGWAARRSLR